MRGIRLLCLALAIGIATCLQGAEKVDTAPADIGDCRWAFAQGQRFEYQSSYSETSAFGDHRTEAKEEYQWSFAVKAIREDKTAVLEFEMKSAKALLRSDKYLFRYDSQKAASQPERPELKEIAERLVGKTCEIAVAEDGKIVDSKNLAQVLAGVKYGTDRKVAHFLDMLFSPLSGNKQGDNVTKQERYESWLVTVLEGSFPGQFKADGYFTEEIEITPASSPGQPKCLTFAITSTLAYAHPDRKEEGRGKGSLSFSKDGFLISNSRKIDFTVKDSAKDPRPAKATTVWSVSKVGKT